ncbi:MAG: hypothetical protein V1733_04665 [bacterium]
MKNRLFLLPCSLFILHCSLFTFHFSLNQLSAQPADHPLFAPYVDVYLWPPFDISKTDSTGICYYTLAFIVDDPWQSGPNPCWGGYSVYDTTWYQSQIAGLRANGGEVIISCGGANGTELAYVATNPVQLKNAYQLVVDAYALQSIDFDIEGMLVADTASVHRRSAALKLLQDDNPGLEISLTLPVMPYGLTPDGINVVASAVEHGVELGVVNIMAMDYGPVGDMGDWAMQAADNLFLQLQTIYLQAGITLPDSIIWKKEGITPMIGQNDVPGEIFYLDDAADVRGYALNHQIGRVAMWSANRDQPCAHSWDPLYICSHIPQDTFEFSQTFMLGGVMNYCLWNSILQNVTIPNGQTSCYAATQTITVAGNGTQFTVLTGGSVTLIAGQNILLLPGTKVYPGGYLLGSITTTGQYCSTVNPTYPSLVTNALPDPDEFQEKTEVDSLFRIYPNPTTGDFTIQSLPVPQPEFIVIRLLDQFGKQILKKRWGELSRRNLLWKDSRRESMWWRCKPNGLLPVRS